MKHTIDDITLQSLLDLTQSDGITPLFDVNKLIPFPNIIHGPQHLSVSEYARTLMDKCSISQFTQSYVQYEVMTSIAILFVAMKPDTARWLLENPKYQVNLNQCDGVSEHIEHNTLLNLSLLFSIAWKFYPSLCHTIIITDKIPVRRTSSRYY